MHSQDRGNKKRTRYKVRNEKVKKSEKSVNVFSDRLDQIEEKITYLKTRL